MARITMSRAHTGAIARALLHRHDPTGTMAQEREQLLWHDGTGMVTRKIARARWHHDSTVTMAQERE